MTYVPGFAWDIFISYPREHAQWVQRFRADLEVAVNQRIASRDQPKIYFDHRSFEAGQHSRQMLEAARNAALFLAVISPAYVAPGKYTLEELKAFCGARPSGDRIISVYVLPIEGALRPPALRGPRREEFFCNNARQVAETLRPELKDHEGEYYSRLSTVAQQIVNRLDEARRAAGGAPAPTDPQGGAIFNGKTVVLAQVTDDLVQEREQVRAFLEQFGVTVLPQGDYPDWGPAFVAAFEADLGRADLFVQLLSEVRSPKHDGESSCAQFQYLAATDTGRDVLQWRSAQLDLSKVPAHYDRLLLESPHVLAMGLEEFKREVKKKLERLTRPPEVEKSADGPPYLYITADEPDLSRALDLQETARRLGAASRIMEDVHRFKEFREQVEGAQAVVFLYGAAPRPFVDAWLTRYLTKIKLTGDLKRLPRVEAVYHAPPPKNKVTEKLRTTWDGLRQLGSQDAFSTGDIEKILSELRGVAPR